MSLFAWIMTGVYLPVYILIQLISLVVGLVSHVLFVFLSLVTSITSSVAGAISLLSVVFGFMPLSWAVSLIVGLGIVNAETVIYWLKKIWEIIPFKGS